VNQNVWRVMLKKNNDICIIHLKNSMLVSCKHTSNLYFIFYSIYLDAAKSRSNTDQYLLKNLEEKEREFLKKKEQVKL
jgi:hypothetical protein